jgi:hypothetical protein
MSLGHSPSMQNDIVDVNERRLGRIVEKQAKGIILKKWETKSQI